MKRCKCCKSTKKTKAYNGFHTYEVIIATARLEKVVQESSDNLNKIKGKSLATAESKKLKDATFCPNYDVVYRYGKNGQ